eukprot:scaffold181108_cov32-Prasinocladus_malaysianus.AAC.4
MPCRKKKTEKSDVGGLTVASKRSRAGSLVDNGEFIEQKIPANGNFDTHVKYAYLLSSTMTD